MIRTRAASDLEPWLNDASTSLIASFANGVMRDRAAVGAAVAQEARHDAHDRLR